MDRCATSPQGVVDRAVVPNRDLRQADSAVVIQEVRGHRIVLDEDLAALYVVPTRALNQAVRRNRSRFPEDFLFQLTAKEVANLKSQSVTSSWGGRRRSLPWAFTEHGVAMLSNVLRSPRAIAVSIEVVRAFVRLRRLHGEYRELARKIDELEGRYDSQFKVVFEADPRSHGTAVALEAPHRIPPDGATP